MSHVSFFFIQERKNSEHEIYKIRYTAVYMYMYKVFFYSTEREKGKRKDESCETIDIWEDQEI